MNKNDIDKEDYILDMAEKVFVNQGFKAATTREITTVANINSAMLHYYFGSKEKVFETVLNQRIEHLNIRVNLAIKKEMNPLEELMALINLHIELIIENKQFCRLLFSELLLNEKEFSYAIIKSFFSNNINKIRKVLENGIENNFFKTMDIDLILMTIFGILMQNLMRLDELLFQDSTDKKIRVENYFLELFSGYLN